MVKGFVIERRSHHVTHVLLQEGHLWVRRDVVIPISAVTTFEGGIQLDIPRSAVQSLPLVAARTRCSVGILQVGDRTCDRGTDEFDASPG